MPKAVPKGPCAGWAFTWWVEGDANRELLIEELTDDRIRSWVFQQERGEESGNLHFQGRLELKKKIRVGQVVDMFPKCSEVKGMSFSIEHDQMASKRYCGKTPTRVAGPWRDTDFVQDYPEEWKSIERVPFMDELEARIAAQSTREILLVGDPVGNTGKTAWKKLATVQGHVAIPVQKEAIDMMQIAYAKLHNKDRDKTHTIIFDCTRAHGGTRAFWIQMCQVLEAVKDGMAYDKRYHYRECFFRRPKVVVFTNDKPDRDLLSADRWVTWDPTEVGTEEEVPTQPDSP